MGWKAHKTGFSGNRLRLTMSSTAASSRMKLWMVHATTTVLLWTCVMHLIALRHTLGPGVLHGWPSFLSTPEDATAIVRPELVVEKPALPPARVEKRRDWS
jgi:rhamnogalacturonan I rhamnosyltransferase